MGKLTFHNMNHSQSQRILWLLEELDIDYELVNHFRNPNYLAPDSIKAVSSTGSAPVLTLPDGRNLPECQAIATYLIDTYDKQGRFGGGPHKENTKFDWIRDEELTSWASTSLGLMVFLHFVLSIVISMSPWFMRPLLYIGTAPIKMGVSAPRMKAQLKWLEEQLGEEDYLMGKEPGRCDFLISYPLDQIAQRKMVNLKEFPRLVAYRQRIEQRDAWKSALNKGNGYDWTVF